MEEIIKYLKSVGGQTVNEIAAATGYSVSYVNTVCNCLFHNGNLKREREQRNFVYAKKGRS